MVADKARVSELLAWQMGRPIRYGPGEVRGFEERARYMIAVAPEMLADIDVGPKEGFKRFIRREPLGVVLNLPAWNFPYMTALNAVLPAILAGNTVVMKHSSQTALVAEHFADCFEKANLPKDVFQVLHMSHEATERAIRSGLVDQVGFTGSTAGGRAIMAAVAGAPNFPHTCLELGGKDPAYVRPDANLAFAIENVVDAGYLQFRPVVLRGRAHLCPRGGLRRVRRRGGGDDQGLQARLAGRPGDDARAGGPRQGGGFRPRPGREGEAAGREGADRPEALRRPTGRARPISRRSSSSTSIIPWRS